MSSRFRFVGLCMAIVAALTLGPASLAFARGGGGGHGGGGHGGGFGGGFHGGGGGSFHGGGGHSFGGSWGGHSFAGGSAARAFHGSYGAFHPGGVARYGGTFHSGIAGYHPSNGNRVSYGGYGRGFGRGYGGYGFNRGYGGYGFNRGYGYGLGRGYGYGLGRGYGYGLGYGYGGPWWGGGYPWWSTYAAMPWSYYGDYGYPDYTFTEDYAAPTIVNGYAQGIPDAAPTIVNNNTYAESTPIAPATEGDYYARALEAFNEGNYGSALRLAGHAAVDNPRDPNVHLLLSLSMFARGLPWRGRGSSYRRRHGGHNRLAVADRFLQQQRRCLHNATP